MNRRQFMAISVFLLPLGYFLKSLFSASAQNDFENENVEVVDGWVLAATESQVLRHQGFFR